MHLNLKADALFERSAMKAALPEVSKARYEQTLCAEYPALKPILDKLDGEKTQQTPATLAKIWKGIPFGSGQQSRALVRNWVFRERG